MAVTKRCIRCHKKVRPDGTCQNPEFVLYVPEANTETTSESSNTAVSNDSEAQE